MPLHELRRDIAAGAARHQRRPTWRRWAWAGLFGLVLIGLAVLLCEMLEVPTGRLCLVAIVGARFVAGRAAALATAAWAVVAALTVLPLITPVATPAWQATQVAYVVAIALLLSIRPLYSARGLRGSRR